MLALVSGLVACGPIVEQAPFPARPDTLRAGDLLGPFDGMVLDAETERPIAGAVIAASWAFERGVGLQGPAGAWEVVTESGPDGRYRLPVLKDLPSGASTRVRRFTLVVYQKGYVGYRSDRLFPGGASRRDFSQRGCRVRLERWRDDLRHSDHLVFIGGGSAIRAASAWEIGPAALELSGVDRPSVGPAAAAPAPEGPKPLDATPLLSEADVRAVTGYAGAFDVGKLGDLATTEFYDSRHFKAQGRPEGFDVALRVWVLGAAGAEAQFRKLLTELPGASATDEIGDASVRAQSGDVLGLAFLRRDRGVVVSVTCGVQQCTEPSMILRMAKLIEGHLTALPAARPAGDAK